MTPEQWNQLINDHAEKLSGKVRNRIALEARLYLITLAPGIEISTNKLVEALYPRAVADKTLAGDLARRAIYKVIGQLTLDGLQDCCRKGEVNGKFMGRPKRPWLWYCPEGVEVCCMCGQFLPVEDETSL